MSYSNNTFNTNPDMEVLHPINHKSLKGYDKVGAMLVFDNNRGWWTGTIMDEHDARPLLNGRYGPTVLQVAGGVYAAFCYILKHKNKGAMWPDWCDSDFIIERTLPYVGRFVSVFKDLNDSHIKGCKTIESFLNEDHNDKYYEGAQKFYKRKFY